MIKVGQQYESTQADHIGWKVEVKSVSGLQVRTEGLTNPIHGQTQAFPIEGFLRDWVLIKDVKPQIITTNGTHRVCKVCNIDFPLEAEYYQPISVTRGNNKGQPAGYLKTCRDCVAKAKSVPHKKPTTQPSPTIQPAIKVSLSSQLLALATQVEALEYTVRPEYQTLLVAAKQVVTEAEYAHGILVIKRASYELLEKAVQECRE